MNEQPSTLGPATAEARSIESFADEVPDYYLNAIRDFLRQGGFAGKRVLEIGGSSLPSALVLGTLGAEQWVCVDILNHASGSYQQSAHREHYASIGVEPLRPQGRLPDRPYVIYDGSADGLPASFESKFDIVFSINAFEHILPLEQVLERAHKALRSGGQLFAQFGPVWSCIVGSHFWVHPGFNFNTPDPLPPWAHLLMSREQVEAHLLAHGVDDDSRRQALYQIFESSFVNRRFYEDYEAAMAASDFRDYTVEPRWSRHVPLELQQQLEARHPGRTEFAAYGICIVARKTAPAAQPDIQARSVFICGSGRSGTSCLAGMFDPTLYFHGENLFPPSPSNPKGFFENFAINDLNEAILVRSAVAHCGTTAAGTLLDGLAPGQLWLALWPDSMAAQGDEAVQRAIRSHLDRRPFCLKDPRFSVTAPVWLRACPEAIVLCIFRHPSITADSILRECRTAPYLRGLRISVADAFAVWRQMYRRALELYRTHPNVLFMSYDDLFDATRLAALGEILHAPLDLGFPDRSLDRASAELPADPASLALLDVLQEVSRADFGRQREASLARVEAFRLQHRAAADALPPGWKLAV